MWDHTVLPATRHKWTHPAITPANQAGTRFTYPGGMEGWVDLGSLLVKSLVIAVEEAFKPAIGIGDGGRQGGKCFPQNSGKIFFRQKSCKIREFCQLLMHIFSGKNVLPPKLTELLASYAYEACFQWSSLTQLPVLLLLLLLLYIHTTTSVHGAQCYYYYMYNYYYYCCCCCCCYRGHTTTPMRGAQFYYYYMYNYYCCYCCCCYRGLSTTPVCYYNYTVSQKKGDTILLSISLLNIDQFSQFFHRHTQLEICNKIINKDPTSPQMCCYTTLWNVNVRK